jgi:hypothetical protein
MMWILVILAVHVNDPEDIPGRVSLEFSSQKECESAQSTIQSWIKFKSFKVTSECKKQ